MVRYRRSRQNWLRMTVGWGELGAPRGLEKMFFRKEKDELLFG